MGRGEPAPSTGSRILVVDDEEHIRRLCHHILSIRGYLPRSTSLPREALSYIESERFDLLLTDLAMPQIDGLELLRRAKEFRSDLPVVIITGHGTLDKAIQSLHHGADGFVIKPFSESELLTAVEEALEKSRLVQENLRLRLLMPLFEVTRNLLSERDLCSVLNQVLEVSRRETKSAVSAILVEGGAARFFPPPEKEQIGRYQALCREAGERVRGRSDPLLLSAVAPSGVPKSPAFGVDLETGAQSNDSAEDPAVALLRELQIRQMIAAPLGLGDDFAGSLYLFQREADFAQADLELVSILGRQALSAIENVRLFEQLERTQFLAMKVLAQAIEEKDQYTAGHCDRMVDYAMGLADRLGITAEEKKHLGYAAALHDIGKIGVQEVILNKSGKLTEREYDRMKKHSEMGASIIKEVEFLEPAVPIIYHHQERFDGKGYPEGLIGEEIPLGARIIAILDTYDAMTSDRPYRKALPVEIAFEELRRCAGRQFDPRLVEVFIQMVSEDLAPQETSFGGA